jgi:hypothetical protein
VATPGLDGPDMRSRRPDLDQPHRSHGATLEALERLAVRTLRAAGEHDMPDFIEGAQQLAQTLPTLAT